MPGLWNINLFGCRFVLIVCTNFTLFSVSGLQIIFWNTLCVADLSFTLNLCLSVWVADHIVMESIMEYNVCCSSIL
jgi:hypothetical protein